MDNESSVQGAWPVNKILYTSQEPLTNLSLSVLNFHSNSVQFLFDFCSIFVQFPLKFHSIELKLNKTQYSHYVIQGLPWLNKSLAMLEMGGLMGRAEGMYFWYANVNYECHKWPVENCFTVQNANDIYIYKLCYSEVV